jgi:hypothetical protein
MTFGRIASRSAPLLAPALLILAFLAQAARPLTVDDAAVAEEKGCQVESWIDSGSSFTTGWFVPSCNFGANTEWQLGFARTHAAGTSRFSDTYAQAKVLWHELSDQAPWGTGLTVGFERHPLNPNYSGWNNPYIIVPFSWRIGDTPFLAHANVGWTHDRGLQRETALWGAALEATVNDRLTLLGEAFNDNTNKSFVRLGGRWEANPNLSFDLSFVARSRGQYEGRYVSIGLFWQSGPFMR